MNSTATTHAVDTIAWQDSFETGVGDIDDQHRVLINTLNEANARLRSETRQDAIDQLLKDLLAYALYHFDTEESLMKTFDYAGHDAPMAERHVAQHRQFAATVVDMRERFVATGELDREALLVFLNEWLTGHILGLDRKLGDFVARQEPHV
jgi:hemerythrin-like metal-binding protein